MKVLITGSAGFIGSNLALRLLERGDTVIGIDNHNDLVRLTNGYHSIYKVIHFAGLKAVSESKVKPIDYSANNV